jgi:MFS family permease
MKQTDLSRHQIAFILGGAALMLSLAMGMRQSFGLFQPHLIREIGITAADFSLAIALQNIVWGATQPFMGIFADRYGARPVTLFGVIIYALGLAFAMTATSAWSVTLGMGLCVGLALSCTASNIAMSVTAKAISPAKRSMAMGSVSALGSLAPSLQTGVVVVVVVGVVLVIVIAIVNIVIVVSYCCYHYC